jgi:hypothetical protein
MVVLNASQQPSEVCSHERRPGTTVCLHCRHQARLVARARRKRLLLQGSAVAVVLAVVGAAAMLSADALRNRGRAGNSAGSEAPNLVAVASAKPGTADVPSQSISARSTTRPPVTQEGEVSRPPAAPLAPIVARGQTSLGDSVTVTRGDSSIVVEFDTPDARTRIPEKFEAFVRATLPRLYGPAADSALAKMPSGGIANSQQALLYDLPVHGIRIALDNGWWIVLYPEIRAGRDGPLVVRYRAAVVNRTN